MRELNEKEVKTVSGGFNEYTMALLTLSNSVMLIGYTAPATFQFFSSPGFRGK